MAEIMTEQMTEQMTYTNKERLLDRLECNYLTFKLSLRGVSRDRLFEMAGRIAAVTETYVMLTTDYAWGEEPNGEVDFYLLFRDPLTIIADAWEQQRRDMAADFDAAMFRLCDDETLISQYPLLEGVACDITYTGGRCEYV